MRKLRATEGKDILILGSGQRLFDVGTAYADLKLLDTRTSTTGVVVATYDVASAQPA